MASSFGGGRDEALYSSLSESMITIGNSEKGGPPQTSSLLSLLPSPKEKGRCCIAKPSFITTTSALYLYSALSESLIIIGVFEKRGL